MSRALPLDKSPCFVEKAWMLDAKKQIKFKYECGCKKRIIKKIGILLITDTWKRILG
jgi:hypothetical protein